MPPGRRSCCTHDSCHPPDAAAAPPPPAARPPAAQVWHLRVDVHVLDHQGNLVDACGLSALGALMAFRRPDATVGGGPDGQAVTVHSPDVREPLPLSIHHLPVPVSFAFFEVMLLATGV